MKDQSFEDMLEVIKRSDIPYKWERKLVREFAKYREEHYRKTESMLLRVSKKIKEDSSI